MLKPARVIIPPSITFADLRLERGPVGLRFAMAPLLAICAESGIDTSVLDDMDNRAALISAWYIEHRARGGEIDAIAEDIVAEALAEGNASHPAGRA